MKLHDIPDQTLEAVDFRLLEVLHRAIHSDFPAKQVEINCRCGNRERFIGLQLGTLQILKGLFIQNLASGEFTLVRGTVTRYITSVSGDCQQIVLRCTNPSCINFLSKDGINNMNYTLIRRDRITRYDYLYIK